jgi:hypothetical protein
MRSLPFPRFLLAAASLALTTGAAHALTDAQKCESVKHGAVAKYAQCRLKADATYAKTLDAPKRTAAYDLCAQKLALAYAKVEAAYGGSCPVAGDQTAVEAFVEDCTAKARDWTAGGLSAPLVFTRFPVTGQTTCFSTSGTSVPCAGTGQDGEVQAGAAARFTDNGDGTVTDGNSGLMWEKLTDDGGIHDQDATYTWSDAVTVKIAALNTAGFAGYDDWRLPNVRELQSLVHYGVYGPAVSGAFDTGCASGCDGLACSCTPFGTVTWSSTSHVGASGYAWSIYFGDGQQSAVGKTGPATVRAVRGGR